MKRVILDTNIYGFILDNDEPDEIEDSVAKSDIIIYGVRIIRKELRDTSKKSTVYHRSRKAIRNLRSSLLALYDTITKKEYEVSEKMKALAAEYFTAYKEFGGKSKEAVKSYRLVNTLRKYRTPEFIGYSEFRRLLP